MRCKRNSHKSSLGNEDYWGSMPAVKQPTPLISVPFSFRTLSVGIVCVEMNLSSGYSSAFDIFIFTIITKKAVVNIFVQESYLSANATHWSVCFV